MLLSISPAVAQTKRAPTRTKFVFHVYVDPIHGDNARAFATNPRSASIPGQLPLDFHPEPTATPPLWPIGGVLQHAPYHFKTLTGVNGALAWIQSLLLPANQQLPWTNPAGGRSVDWIVVHCLPGLYGPLGDGLPDFDPVSGLRFNGEVWPARIRTRVSLQGTSALDTIFDARGKVTTILDVNDGIGMGSLSHEETFIDSLSLRGARSPATTPPPTSIPDGAGSAIHVWCDYRTANVSLSNRVTISNCFIYDNVAGIAINSWMADQGSQVHYPAIVNNTIAWNATGLWCGTSPATGFSSNSGALLVNNVFDSGSPPGFIAGISGFGGVTQHNLAVTQIGGVLAMPGQDFNAWEYSATPGTYVNRNFPIAPNWPATFHSPVVTLPPRIQVQAYTQPGRPGALYVNDILRRAPPQAVPAGYDYSRHDFRLAPCVTTTSSPPTPNQTSPLVNQGLDLANLTLYPVASTYRTLTYPPGLPANAESCPVHAYDWDAEGFGNPRVQGRSGFLSGVINWPGLSQISTNMDLGADEMGNLIMAGYVPNTRMFHYHQDGLGNVVDQTMVLYFDIVGDSRPRPWCNLLWGGRHEPSTLPANAYSWFQHKFSGMADADQGNFTTIPFPFFHNLPPLLIWDPYRHRYTNPAWLAPGFSPFSPHMRSLECDFGGCLLPDMNPRWAQLANNPPVSLSLRDEYGANPWWGHAQPPQLGTPPSPPCRDNPTVYHNHGADAHDSSIFGVTTTVVFDATMNPPGSGIFFGSVYLDLSYTNLLFGPWTPCAGGASYLAGAWGYGDTAASCPERIPFFAPLDSLGMRWNCQTSELSNLQTFLSVVAGVNPGIAGSTLTRKALTMPGERIPSIVEILSFPSRLSRPGAKQ